MLQCLPSMFDGKREKSAVWRNVRTEEALTATCRQGERESTVRKKNQAEPLPDWLTGCSAEGDDLLQTRSPP